MGWLSAGLGLLTGGLSSAVGAYSASKATRAQIAWEKERAQNAHQWEVEDLRNAGLNPILSAGGSGAVTGSISAPTFGADFGKDVTSARQTAINKKAVESQTELNQASSAERLSQSARNEASIINESEVAKAQVAMMKAQENSAKAQTLQSQLLTSYMRNPVYKAGYQAQFIHNALQAGAAVGASLFSKGSNSAKSNVVDRQHYLEQMRNHNYEDR